MVAVPLAATARLPDRAVRQRVAARLQDEGERAVAAVLAHLTHSAIGVKMQPSETARLQAVVRLTGTNIAQVPLSTSVQCPASYSVLLCESRHTPFCVPLPA